jgi:hypothetical protein
VHIGCGSGTTAAPDSGAQYQPLDAMASNDAAPDATSVLDAGALPPGAHSSSFFPVQGVLDNGQPADELYWDYRIDHGQPHVSGTNPGVTFQFQDEINTVRQATLVVSDSATVSGSASGTSSSVITEQIDPNTSAVLSVSADSQANLSTGSSDIMLTETWNMPVPQYFDRSDLDTLAIGYSENTMAITGTVTGTVTVSGAGSQQATGTASVSSSWTLLDKLAQYTVLGVTYADVVKVQTTSVANVQIQSATGQTSTSMSTTTATGWLAKGIGIVYSENTTQQQSGTDTTVSELVATNLVPPVTGDAGADGAVSDGGTPADH